MDPLEAHRRAQDAFGRALARVSDDQLDAQTPCTEWRVRDLVAHVIAGNQRIASGTASFSPGDEKVAELADLHASSATGAQTTFAAPDGLTRTFELPFGTVPGSRLVGMRATDVLTHSWDLAQATGQPTSDIDGELATELLTANRGFVGPEHRGPGRPFGDEQEAGPDAPPADRLAAFFGRAQP